MIITSNTVVDFIKSMLSDEKQGTENTVIVKVKPDLYFSIRKDMLTDHNKKRFINAVKKIPRICENLSYRQMIGHSELNLLISEVLAMIAIGKAMGVWRLFPQDISPDNCDHLFNKDPYGVLPMVMDFKEE